MIWIIEAWRILNIVLAGWVVSWMPVVYRARVASEDPMRGEWLAVAMGLLMFAVIVGSAASVADHRVFSYGLPFTTAGLFVAAWARHKVKQKGTFQ